MPTIYQVQTAGVYPSQFYEKGEALEYARKKAQQTGKKYKVFALSGGKKKALNPRGGQLLFRTRAAAVKYAREYGAKKYSIRKLRTAK